MEGRHDRSKGQQIYKIYLNDKLLVLCWDNEKDELIRSFEHPLVIPYISNVKSIFNYLDTLEKSDRYDAVVLYSKKGPRYLFQTLRKIARWVPAAGGIVSNDQRQVLAIFRIGHWDLPKGKIDFGENTKEAAEREVMEETGLQGIRRLRKIGKTYHLFRGESNRWRLKKTSWYAFQLLEENPQLRAQTEEGITRISWVDPDFFIDASPCFESIRDIMIKYRKKMKSIPNPSDEPGT